MKGILEFNLPEEAEEHHRAIHATDWALAALDMDNYLRGRLKYEELSDDVDDALDKAREKLWESLENYNLSLNDIS